MKPFIRIDSRNGPLNNAIPKSLAFIAALALIATLEPSGVQAAALRTVAISGQPAPGTPNGMAYNSFGSDYDSLLGVFFRGPVLNDAGQTAFRADIAGSGVDSANNRGVWSEGSGSLALVARTGSQAPGVSNGLNFRTDPTLNLFSPVLNRAGQTAFYGGLTDGSVGIWSGGSGSLGLIARSGVQAPGAPAGVNLSFSTGVDRFHLDWPKLNNAGQTAFFGALTGAGVTATNNWGVWSSGSGSLELVARAGDQAPGLPSGAIYGASTFSPLPAFVGGLSDAGHIALEANLAGSGVIVNDSYGIWTGGSGSLTLVTRSAAHAPGTLDGVNYLYPLAAVALNHSGQVAFAARLTGSGVNSTNDAGLWSSGSGNLELVARSGSQAAGMPSGVNYSSFPSFSVLNDAGQIAFREFLTGSGVDSTNNLGIWTDGSGALALVARTGRQAPGTAGGVNFFDLNYPALNSAGQTAFRADLAGSGVNSTNNRGIWATDWTGVLQLIARRGELLEVAPGDFRTLGDLDFVTGTGNGDSRPSGFNNLGQLVFWASFMDGSQGVFVSNKVAGLPGDFNRDGSLTGDDIQAMLLALTDLHAYETATGLSEQALAMLGELNADQVINNADIQPLLGLLARGDGSTAVPEPHPFALLAISFATLVAARLKRRAEQ
jgi:hypothetical protein